MPPLRLVDAYYSDELKCWVRMERECDYEWCHTSGYPSREAALAGCRHLPLYSEPPLPAWLQPSTNDG